MPLLTPCPTDAPAAADRSTGSDAPDANRRAQERPALIESTLESIAVGVAVVRGRDCVFELVNPAYQALSPSREMVGRPFAAVWPEAAERLVPILHRVMDTGAPFDAVDMRIDLERTPGAPLEESYFSFSCRRLRGCPGDVPAVVAHVLDTTQLVLARRQAEDRAQARAVLLAAEHAARELAERARDRFERLASAADARTRRQELASTILAHDLRSPIEAIAVTSRALIQRSGLDERQIDAVGRIASIAKRMDALVEELLEVGRARHAGGLPVERQRADIEAICARAIEQHLASRPGSEVAFTVSGEREGLWDPSRLEQVVSNLVGNALERSPAGTPVQVTARGAETELVLEVRNQGPVIPAEVMGRLFQPFVRGDGNGAAGLGLFIVSEIVRAHRGEVRVTSDPADGTCFTVRLPRSGPAT